MTEQSSTIFGIDLGTTFSCIAHIDEYGRPAAIINAEGSRITPSVVFFDGNNRTVGAEAKNIAIMYPNQVVSLVKRQMGSDWVFHYDFDGVDYTPEEISSYIIKKLVNDAQQSLGCIISDVVITCPAYFGINEREATAKAGKIAGLNVRSIINEPTAAALSYVLHEEKDQVVLVYDLGGGTFDITMIEIKVGEINVIATGGNHFLGGRNWDEVIVNYLSEEWKAATDSDEEPLDDLETVQDLFLKAEAAKISLSNPARDKTEVAVAHAGERKKITLTREKFDELTANLLERTIQYTYEMLEEAKKKGYTQFDQILLVGGATRMPQVIERVRQEFKMEPKIYDPDEAVAKGAAWYGQKLAIDEAIKIKIEGWGHSSETADTATKERAQQEVADDFGYSIGTVKQFNRMTTTIVTSHSFGVVALNRENREVVNNLIVKNTSLPTVATQTFGTVEANQQNAYVQIMENLYSEVEIDPSNCEEVGTALLNLPSGLPQGSPVEITFELNDEGRLHVIARELNENQTVETDIQTTRIISEEKLEEAKARSQQLKFY
jgi:molecular chaperone DnaK